MPHKEVNVRMRVTIVMLILNVFIWLVVIENIKSIISMKNEPIVIENHNSVKSIVPVVSAAETVVEDKPEEVINEPINIVNVIKTRFNKAPRTASAVSFAESRHIATKSSDSDKMRDGRPVSYTHLDVYKRQVCKVTIRVKTITGAVQRFRGFVQVCSHLVKSLPPTFRELHNVYPPSH